MKKEELQRLDEGRRLLDEIIVMEKFLKVVLDPEFEVMSPRLYAGGRVENFPIRDDGFNRAYREFIKEWVESYLIVLNNKFEAL